MNISTNQLAAAIVIAATGLPLLGWLGGVFDWFAVPRENERQLVEIQTLICDRKLWTADACKIKLPGWTPPAREYRVYSSKANTERGALEAAEEADRTER